MEGRNGYFQIIRNENKTMIKLVPPIGNGQKIDINEVVEYLENNNIKEYNLVNLNKAIASCVEVCQLDLEVETNYAINEFMKISISENQLFASVRFYPPSNDGQRMTKDEMISDLKAAKVVYGIDDTELDKQLATPVYCKDFIIAKGKEVREGTDAFIEYRFNTDIKVQPKHNDDGSVDFHQLNNISHIKAGDVLAVLHKADLGENGINILGMPIAPRQVKQAKLAYGKNISISEDKCVLTSKVNGHASLQGDRVFVSDIYDVPGDVDNSTGDIDYEGNVMIHGNVRTGFKVRAAGDVEVFGVVEGAEIIAGGQVVLHHGIQGMTKGLIVAKGNIVTKFIESSKIYAEGYIESDSIIQSQVSAKDNITVSGSKGNIIGGYVRSSTMVEAKVIGSAMGITTLIEVGSDPVIQEKLKTNTQSLTNKSEELKKLIQICALFNKKLVTGMITNDQRLTYKNAVKKVEQLKNEIEQLQSEITNMNASLQENRNARVNVSRTIFPGAQISILGEHYNVLEELSYCSFCLREGAIKNVPL